VLLLLLLLLLAPLPAASWASCVHLPDAEPASMSLIGNACSLLLLLLLL
jgi:hypothetical protein